MISAWKLFRGVSEGNVVMVGMGIFFLWAMIAHPNVEFTYYRSTKPFPNQKLARIVFYAAGIVLTLGGLWGLWLDLRFGR